MENQIPAIVEELYHSLVGSPNPELWPEFSQKNPIQGHGLWAFYRGLSLGLKIANACNEL